MRPFKHTTCTHAKEHVSLVNRSLREPLTKLIFISLCFQRSYWIQESLNEKSFFFPIQVSHAISRTISLINTYVNIEVSRYEEQI